MNCTSTSVTAGRQWRRHGGEWRGPDPPTSVQTPLGISANPLKSFFTYGGGVPQVCILSLLMLTSKETWFGPPHFFGAGDATAGRRGYINLVLHYITFYIEIIENK